MPMGQNLFRGATKKIVFFWLNTITPDENNSDLKIEFTPNTKNLTACLFNIFLTGFMTGLKGMAFDHDFC